MEDGDFGVGSIWRRIAASGLGGQDAGVAAVGRLAARMVEGAGAGKRWELRVDVGERRWDGAVWRVETLEVVGLRSGRKAIWGVAGIGGEAGSMTIPMVAADEACRVRLEFSRVSGFEDSELWKVDPIALPGVGSRTRWACGRARWTESGFACIR